MNFLLEKCPRCSAILKCSLITRKWKDGNREVQMIDWEDDVLFLTPGKTTDFKNAFILNSGRVI